MHLSRPKKNKKIRKMPAVFHSVPGRRFPPGRGPDLFLPGCLFVSTRRPPASFIFRAHRFRKASPSEISEVSIAHPDQTIDLVVDQQHAGQVEDVVWKGSRINSKPRTARQAQHAVGTAFHTIERTGDRNRTATQHGRYQPALATRPQAPT